MVQYYSGWSSTTLDGPVLLWMVQYYSGWSSTTLDGPVLLRILPRSCSHHTDYGIVSFCRLHFGRPDAQTKSRSPNLALPFGHELRK